MSKIFGRTVSLIAQLFSFFIFSLYMGAVLGGLPPPLCTPMSLNVFLRGSTTVLIKFFGKCTSVTPMK